MIKPVTQNVIKVYIEEKGRKIEVENVVGFYPELKLIDIIPDFRKESHSILRERVYSLKPFEVFIVFEGKEISFLGSVDIKVSIYESSGEDCYYDPAEIFPSSSHSFAETEMYINLYQKESE